MSLFNGCCKRTQTQNPIIGQFWKICHVLCSIQVTNQEKFMITIVICTRLYLRILRSGEASIAKLFFKGSSRHSYAHCLLSIMIKHVFEVGCWSWSASLFKTWIFRLIVFYFAFLAICRCYKCSMSMKSWQQSNRFLWESNGKLYWIVLVQWKQ